MLIRHAGIYALARAMPGLVSLMALSIYTRWLTPHEYGLYTLVLASLGVWNAIAFYWLRVSAIRHLPVDEDRRPAFLGALYVSYLCMAIVSLLIGGVALAAIHGEGLRTLILAGVFLLMCQTWLELKLDLLVAALEPGKYAVITLARAVLAACIGGWLAYAGAGAEGVIVGLAVGYLLPALAIRMGKWRAAPLSRPDWHAVRTILHFGLPLAGVFAFGVFTVWSDRILLGSIVGTQAVGQYAAASDLALPTITALMMTVNLSALPLAVRAYQTVGETAAADQLREHGVVLVALALPATVGLAVLAFQVSSLVLGAQFHASARYLIPLIAVGAFLSGMKAFYFDLAFQLGSATRQQLRVSAVAAVVGVVLNLLWIPRFGAMGSAYAMVVTFALACLLSAIVGRRAFRVPIPTVDWAKIAGATFMMAIALSLFPKSATGFLDVGLRVAWGFAAYLVALVLFDVGQSRRYLAAAALALKTRWRRS